MEDRKKMEMTFNIALNMPDAELRIGADEMLALGQLSALFAEMNLLTDLHEISAAKKIHFAGVSALKLVEIYCVENGPKVNTRMAIDVLTQAHLPDSTLKLSVVEVISLGSIIMHNIDNIKTLNSDVVNSACAKFIELGMVVSKEMEDLLKLARQTDAKLARA